MNTTLMILLAVTVILAWGSQRKAGLFIYGNRSMPREGDLCLVLLVIFWSLFAGLRTDWNDTTAYIGMFNESVKIGEFISDSANFSPTQNPLFYLLMSLVRTFTDQSWVFLTLCSFFVNISFINFIKKFTPNQDFALSIYLFVTLGTYMFSLEAVKQVLAMAILLYAISALIEKKYKKFYVLVLIALLFHTYAVLLVVLPFFTSRPWRFKTYAVVIVTLLILRNFQGTITAVIGYADTVGKEIAEEEVFSGYGMSLFRVAVYAIVPLATFVYQKKLIPLMDKRKYLLTNMSILSFMFVLMASQDGANMFGRMAKYFEIGTSCMIPFILRTLFERKSLRMVVVIVMILFMCFFLYDNAGFATEFRAYYLK